jgi:hypothetical protein
LRLYTRVRVSSNVGLAFARHVVVVATMGIH